MDYSKKRVKAREWQGLMPDWVNREGARPLYHQMKWESLMVSSLFFSFFIICLSFLSLNKRSIICFSWIPLVESALSFTLEIKCNSVKKLSFSSSFTFKVKEQMHGMEWNLLVFVSDALVSAVWLVFPTRQSNPILSSRFLSRNWNHFLSFFCRFFFPCLHAF